MPYVMFKANHARRDTSKQSRHKTSLNHEEIMQAGEGTTYIWVSSTGCNLSLRGEGRGRSLFVDLLICELATLSKRCAMHRCRPHLSRRLARCL
jgi:hypothetical protein